MNPTTETDPQRWDHAKASTLAAVLVEEYAFNNRIAAAETELSIQDKGTQGKIEGYNTKISKHDLDAPDVPGKPTAAQLLSAHTLQRDLVIVQGVIEKRVSRHKKHQELARESDEYLTAAETLYDSDPERYTEMDTIGFASIVRTLDQAQARIREINGNGIRRMYPVDLLQQMIEDEIELDNFKINEVFRYTLSGLGTVTTFKEGDEQRIREEFSDLLKDSFNSSPRSVIESTIAIVEKYKKVLTDEIEEQNAIVDSILGTHAEE